MISIVNDQRVARVSELIPILGLKAVPNINVLIMNDFAVLELNKTSMMIIELGIINITPGTPINGDLAYSYNSCSPEQPTMCSHDTLLEMHLKNIYQKYSYEINGGGAKLVATKQNIISTGDFNDFMQMKSKDGCRFYRMTGLNMNKSMSVEHIEEEAAASETAAEEIRKPENVVSLLSVDPIELEFGYGIIPLADVNQGGDLLDRVVMIRRQIALELGTVVPIIRLRDNIQLNPNQYIIKIKGIQVAEGEILFDHYMAMNPGFVEEQITGIPTFEPSFHLPAIWITESQRERAESLGYTVVDPPSIIATHLTEIIRTHIAELLTRQDVQNLVDNVKENNPVLVDELVPKLLGIGEIQKVLQNLLAEGISIRDLLTIFETLADHATTSRDTDVLTEYVRQSLKRAISNKYFPANESTSVVTLDPKIEQEIMSSVKQTEQGAYLTLDPERTKAIIEATSNEVEKLENLGKSAIVVTSPIVRMYYKKLTEEYLKDLIVVSYNEIESNVELQSVGMVTC